ncbi:hypothetical protein [Pseudoalteromonas aliena]|uniref:Uncharacterized protein n=1 Tax=Pseudoalteromonas aliena SW19 TaxID=1314866 RepID=A0ABR9E4T8_9GAMM|nr:hypothetical protein [Pseudoalteromonas aliena]MBE0361625.1 hypothetical protein [Pseudoalteromonas aliena SW19]
MQAIDYVRSIKNKELNQLTIEELAHVHLNSGLYNEIKGALLDSSLTTLIDEIRHAKFQHRSKSFLPVTAAFTILDQLGFCYSRKDMPLYSNVNASNIKKSLYYFCGFEENDKATKTLYALRNSFLHTASILAKAEFPNQPNHRFVYDREQSDLLRFPEVEWDGDFNNLTSEMSTRINPEIFVNMVEDAARNAKEHLYNNNLNIDCINGEPEFYYRFLGYRAK